MPAQMKERKEEKNNLIIHMNQQYYSNLMMPFGGIFPK